MSVDKNVFDVNSHPLSRRRFLCYGAMLAASTGIRPVFAEQKRYDVLVIGAGLAGLQCTRLLQQHGISTLLLEGGDRVGGRVHTLDELEGRPEAGGTQTGTGYTALNQVADELQITFTSMRPGMPGMTLSIKGELMDADTWENSAVNQLTEPYRKIQPRGLMYALLARGEQLTTPLAWNTTANARLDIPLSAYLTSLGADKEMLRLINANLNGTGVDQISAADVLRKSRVLQSAGGPQRIKGGSQRLPDALAATLTSRVQLNKPVVAINDTGRHIAVICADGSQYLGERGIIALPYSVLRHIRIDAPLSPAKQSAINKLAYTPVTITLMQPSSPFWLEDGLSPAMWTDAPVGRIFTETDDNGELIRIRSWVMGPFAERLNKMTDDATGEFIKETLARLRPSTKGKLEVEKVISWGRNPLARGAFSHYLAGDVQGFSHIIGKPEGRLHFIGEHTAPEAAGMEAAILSANRGALEVMNV